MRQEDRTELSVSLDDAVLTTKSRKHVHPMVQRQYGLA
jgi:hypothetical protein